MFGQIIVAINCEMSNVEAPCEEFIGKISFTRLQARLKWAVREKYGFAMFIDPLSL